MTMVLVDTSVWVDHFRQRNVSLVALLAADAALVHPMVLGELACGTPPARAQTLADLARLAAPQQANLREVMALVERENLFDLGCGFVDLSLLASTLLTPGAVLWTLDKRLGSLAERFGVIYRPAMH
jgi:predicted nucleic acid-binding protein